MCFHRSCVLLSFLLILAVSFFLPRRGLYKRHNYFFFVYVYLLVQNRWVAVKIDSVPDTWNKSKKKAMENRKRKKKRPKVISVHEKRRLAKQCRSWGPWRHKQSRHAPVLHKNVENVSVCPNFSVCHLLPKASVGHTLNMEWRSSTSTHEGAS